MGEKKAQVCSIPCLVKGHTVPLGTFLLTKENEIPLTNVIIIQLRFKFSSVPKLVVTTNISKIHVTSFWSTKKFQVGCYYFDVFENCKHVNHVLTCVWRILELTGIKRNVINIKACLNCLNNSFISSIGKMTRYHRA